MYAIAPHRSFPILIYNERTWSKDRRIIMIPAGYMAKRVTGRPEWLHAERVADVYSVSGCVSPDFADYVTYWKHNGFWFFNSPEIIRQLAQEHALDLTGTRTFYYEVYELQFDTTNARWSSFTAEPSFPTDVVVPEIKTLEGYDVVTFSLGTSAECSPLSCNSLAGEVETNTHCLLTSRAQAIELLERGAFKNTEPGPCRIFAVYSV